MTAKKKTTFSAITTTLAITAALFLVVQRAEAGPITGGPGNPPFTKVGVYQGIISVVPGGAGDSVMEIGNAGRDIKSTGGIGFYPGTGANVYVTSGKLCFGAIGNNSNCYDQTNIGAGGSMSLDQVLAVGNKSNHDIILGQGTGLANGVAYIDVAESAGSPQDGISGKVLTVNNTKSALYGENASANGWAGYFSGRVNIVGNLIYQGNLKPKAVNVCQVNSDTCLGRYLYTTGTTRNDNAATGIKFFYDNPTTKTIDSILAYAQTGVVPSCIDPTDVLRQRCNSSSSCRSFYSQAACGSQEWILTSLAENPYGAPGTWVCVDVGAALTWTPASVQSFNSGGACVNSAASVNVTKVNPAQTTTVYGLAYELR